MRDDQRKRLADLSESLTDEALTALDPQLWPGANVPPEDWDAKIRGDRHWMLKNANAAVTLLVNVKRLTEVDPGAPPASDEPTPDDLIKAAEKEAAKLRRQLGDRAPAKH